MDKIELKSFLPRNWEFHQPMTTEDDVMALPGLTPEQQAEIIAELPKVQEEIKAGYQPKYCIDFKTGHVYIEYFPIALIMAKLALRPGPTGVSCCIIAHDGSILAIRRNEKNHICPGFLGPVAGYLTARQNYETIGDLITAEIIEQMEHEIGLMPDEFEVEIIGYANVDYPIRQPEVIVKVTTIMPKTIITNLAQALKETGPGKLAEKEIYWLSPGRLFTILQNEYLHITPPHAAALAQGMSETYDLDEILNLIACLPTYDVNVVWPIDEFKKVIGYQPPKMEIEFESGRYPHWLTGEIAGEKVIEVEFEGRTPNNRSIRIVDYVGRTESDTAETKIYGFAALGIEQAPLTPQEYRDTLLRVLERYLNHSVILSR